MRPNLFIAILALGIVGCSERNLLGEQVWSDARLAEAEVGFGWNYDVESEGVHYRHVDITIQPDSSYEIQLREYRYGTKPQILDQSKGTLAPELATQLRRNLAQLRSQGGPDLFTTLPGCPELSHPPIEYYVGFQSVEETALTVIERGCETPEAIEAQKIVTKALAAFPKVDRTKLVAGQVEF
jgi:hypothetical protein